MIRIDNLNKYFNRNKNNEIHVINNTTVEFGDTGLVCILGESGSGKTTLLNTIGGLDDFASGSISVDDVTLTGYKSSQIELLRNRKFGYIFQNYYLLGDDTVEYNLRIALEIFDITDAEADERIKYVLEAVDMYKYRKKKISELSGGQRQRVAIARALAKAPDIIFADEPTGNLDENNTMHIMSIIKKVSAKCLVILVTHERRIADFFADRIIEVADGRIVSDRKNNGSECYIKTDDNNIYLQEYEKTELKAPGAGINVYSDGGNGTVRLNIAYVDGVLYVQGLDDDKIVYVNKETDIELVDSKRPEIDMEEACDFEYELESVRLKKRPHLKFREILSMAVNNVRALGKKQIFIFVTFIITAVLLAFATADYYSMRQINIEDVVTDDSHYVDVATERVMKDNVWEYNGEFPAYAKALDEYLDSGMGRFSPNMSIMMYVSSRKFAQYSNATFSYIDFGYVDYNELEESDIVYGRLPQNSSEIVVDKLFYEKLKQSDSFLKNIVNDYDDVLELIVNVGFGSGPLTICGISDTGELSVYLDRVIMCNASNQRFKISTLSQLKSAYPGVYDDVVLADNEVMIKENAGLAGIMFDEMNGQWKAYRKAYVDDDYSASYIISDDALDRYLYCMAKTTRQFRVYTDNQEETIKFWEDRAEEIENSDGLIVKANNKYRDEIDAYREDHMAETRTRNIVTGTVFVVSLIILFFMMKTNSINRTEELVVYRLIGISPKSVTLSYITEIVLMVSVTQLPAILATCGILKYLSGIQNLGFATTCPAYLMAALIVACYLVNILIGLIPVWRIVKLPPAKLAAKNN